ncbi:glycoside hydrolase family 2 protein [Flammeovirgaceae bacterium SG7u.111]|nr:glycoside hydrolase family 2 protein [Flammeovirgaceae bacterium SG7u.132]WPO34218.1 glycoside hydrolase family 2 protein [Flammeovirgaceae bacterium SG7u.111]
MKKNLNLLILAISALFNWGCQSGSSPSTPFTMELNQNWQFRNVGNDTWSSATVPGTVHTDLLNNNEIEDPYYRLNEHDLQWIDKEDWEYQTSFSVSAEVLSKDKVALEFLGLDTYASVYLNDSLLIKTDNMFREYTADCKPLLKEGENTLRILFESPITIGLEKYDGYDYKIPVSNNDLAEIGNVPDGKYVSVYTRKAGYHFGWDWGPRFVTSGVWRPINLKAWNGFEIEDIFIQQKELGEKASMLAHVEVSSLSASEDASVEIMVNGKSIKTEAVKLVTGANKLSIPFEILDPKRWWPNGMGEQYLYDVEVKLTNKNVADSGKKRIGLRTVKLVTEPDEIGTSFYFEVNGHPVFMKGVNYIPLDLFLTRVTDERYEQTLQSAVDANMNMVRVWGGGVYENDVFYEKCDEKGLLVWQDFMFACAMFPGDEAFLENVKQEAIDNVKRLRNHPSIALWCGNNEILAAWEGWGWKNQMIEEQSQEVADKIWKSYQDIFHKVLPEAVAEFDGDRRYWASSPSTSMGVPESATRTAGDMHYWGVWWGKEPFKNYETVMPRFMSEFGFQSFPDFSTVQKYTAPEDHDVYSEVMESHQRSTIGNVTIEEYLVRHYKQPKNFESFLYVSHLLQAKGIGFGMEAHRRNRKHCMGSLYWQINDCWPVASWSSIDYYGKWKALHYRTKKAFEDLLVSYEYTDDSLKAFVISDLLEPVEAELKLTLMDFEGNKLEEVGKAITVKENTSEVYIELMQNKLLKGKNKKTVFVVGELVQGDKVLNQNIHFFAPPKDLALPNPDLSYEVKEAVDQFEVTVKTKKLAKDVYLYTSSTANFSDNYFDLLPGSEVTLSIPKSAASDLAAFKEDLKVMTLVDSY